MRTMIIAAALILSSSLAFAGENCRTSLYSPSKAELSALGLSDTQKEQLRTAQRSYRDDIRPVTDGLRATLHLYSTARRNGDTAAAESYAATIASYRAELKQRRAVHDEQMLNVLTPEQRTRWQAQRAMQH